MPLQLSSGPSDSLIAAIAVHGNGYAIAWNEVVPGSRRLHSDGTRSEILYTAVRR